MTLLKTKSNWIRPFLWLLGFLAIASMSSWVWSSKNNQAQPLTLFLLLPSGQAKDHPVTQAWLDAAAEEGLLLEPLTDDEFIQHHADRRPMAGVILPDTVHPQASDLLINTLYQYVENGGQLLVSFDAALFKLDHNRYAEHASRLSKLVGVRYAMYEDLRDQTLNSATVLISQEGERQLGIQPGKLDFPSEQSEPWGELTTYAYEDLVYDHYRTAPLEHALAKVSLSGEHTALGTDTEKVRTWIRSEEGDTILSLHQHGQGQVMFANLPLGYLKTRTDSYLLHRTLSYFGTDMAGLPRLAATPEGIGGMVLNLHVDSNSAQKPLSDLEQSGWFNDGPYSIHVTAGPDAHREGDGLGLNMTENAWMREFLKRQHAQGHEVGNHGGWTHNVFGYQANEHNQERFVPYLERNHASIQNATGHAPQVYSAPMGNQPTWATHWLHARGFKAFYTTADTGLGATRSYIEGKPSPYARLWNFPISNFKRIATVDELEEFGMQEHEIQEFIVNLFEHVSDNHLVRLFYFHPATTPQYYKTMRALREQAQLLQQKNTFRWYRMADLSDFMNRRADIHWQLHKRSDQHELQAKSQDSLEAMTWIIPLRSAKDLKITQGQGRIAQEENHWLVTAGPGTTLGLTWTPQSREILP